MFDSPNSTPNLNPSFHPLISNNFPFPSNSSLPFLPPFINTHQDLLSDHHFLLPNVHETLIVGETGAPGSCAPPSISKPAPKGRHSKIHTSQGLRDRRVRLSIGIARQFFDLQDMLGFDKASKTLDWLLSKSKNAIKELARSSDCRVAATGQTDSIGSNQNGDHAKEKKKKKKITRARKKICCGNPTAMDQSALTRASTSISAQKDNNNYYFPNLALDWNDYYNPVLQPSSSFVVSSMNLSGTGLGAQREHTMY